MLEQHHFQNVDSYWGLNQVKGVVVKYFFQHSINMNFKTNVGCVFLNIDLHTLITFTFWQDQGQGSNIL